MALNFPDSPTLNQVYTDTTSGFSYQWNGSVWISYSAAATNTIKTLDDISSSFNGSTIAFALTANGVAITPANPQQLIISVGGVVQSPNTDYTISGSNIIFSTAPQSGLTFFGTLFGTAVPVGITTIGDVYNRQTYAVTGVQTNFTFTSGYDVGYLDVFRNGARLIAGNDFAAENGSSFTLNPPAQNGDDIEAVGYRVSTIAVTEGNVVDLNVNRNATVLGITTLGANVSTGQTALLVQGNARVTGILTIGTSSITLDGTNNQIRIGSGTAIAFNENGDTSFTSRPVLIGSATSTGTASQPLQVTGGAYISGNIGIGTTIPNSQSKLNVYGSGRFTHTGSFNGPDDASTVPLIAEITDPTKTTFFAAINPYTNPCFAINVSGYGSTTSQRGYISLFDKTDGNWHENLILNNGRIGIGITNPSTPLGVAGTITELSQGQYWNVVTQADVGIGASQVPLNQYLGQLAFLDEFGINIPQNAQTAAYTLVREDAGKHISITTGGVTVPSGVFEIGDLVMIYNNSGVSQTITQGASTTLRLVATATTGSRTLAQYGIAIILCVASNTFVVYGNGVS